MPTDLLQSVSQSSGVVIRATTDHPGRQLLCEGALFAATGIRDAWKLRKYFKLMDFDDEDAVVSAAVCTDGLL